MENMAVLNNIIRKSQKNREINLYVYISISVILKNYSEEFDDDLEFLRNIRYAKKTLYDEIKSKTFPRIIY